LKGFADPISVHFIASAQGVGGVDAGDLSVPESGEPLVTLSTPVAVVYAVLDGKQISGEPARGALAAVSSTRAVLHADDELEPRADLRLTLTMPGAGEGVTGDLYAKVLAVGTTELGGHEATLRLTSVPEDLGAALRAATL
jgi:hypothetical protein